MRLIVDFQGGPLDGRVESSDEGRSAEDAATGNAEFAYRVARDRGVGSRFWGRNEVIEHSASAAAVERGIRWTMKYEVAEFRPGDEESYVRCVHVPEGDQPAGDVPSPQPE